MGMVLKSKLVAHPTSIIGETRVDDKYKILKERLKVLKGFNVFGVDVIGMCLVPHMVIPLKFKNPEFKKYKGLSFPKNHLNVFIRKTVAYASNEILIMHSFQDSLSWASLD